MYWCFGRGWGISTLQVHESLGTHEFFMISKCELDQRDSSHEEVWFGAAHLQQAPMRTAAGGAGLLYWDWPCPRTFIERSDRSRTPPPFDPQL